MRLRDYKLINYVCFDFSEIAEIASKRQTGKYGRT